MEAIRCSLPNILGTGAGPLVQLMIPAHGPWRYRELPRTQYHVAFVCLQRRARDKVTRTHKLYYTARLLHEN